MYRRSNILMCKLERTFERMVKRGVGSIKSLASSDKIQVFFLVFFLCLKSGPIKNIPIRFLSYLFLFDQHLNVVQMLKIYSDILQFTQKHTHLITVYHQGYIARGGSKENTCKEEGEFNYFNEIRAGDFWVRFCK